MSEKFERRKLMCSYLLRRKHEGYLSMVWKVKFIGAVRNLLSKWKM